MKIDHLFQSFEPRPLSSSGKLTTYGVQMTLTELSWLLTATKHVNLYRLRQQAFWSSAVVVPIVRGDELPGVGKGPRRSRSTISVANFGKLLSNFLSTPSYRR